MRSNFIQTGSKAPDGTTYLDNDWFPNGIPANVAFDESVYFDTSYGFAGFHSHLSKAMFVGAGSGCYDRSSFITGPGGKILVGEYTILNGTTLICNDRIVVGSHCMLAWGSVITDTCAGMETSLPAQRRAIMVEAASDPRRKMPQFSAPRPVVLEDNCWIGFGAVVLPGVRVGRGAIVGCKTIVSHDVPPYAIVMGDPMHITRFMDPDDTEETRQRILAEQFTLMSHV